MSPDAPSICRLYLDFMKRADNLMLAAVRDLPEPVLNRAQGVSFDSLAGTVIHIYQAESIWHRRVSGEPSLQLSEIENPTLAELKSLWPLLHENWRRRAAEMDANTWFQSIL